MDTFFQHSLGAYPFETRCEMLKELGYDAMYFSPGRESDWQDLPKLAGVKATYGLEVAAVYTGLDIAAGPDHSGNARILHLLRTLEGCTRIELSVMSGDNALRPSDPAGDDRAQWWLEQLLRISDERGIDILLYPHLSSWLEQIDDAVRLCRAINHPRLGAVFCGFHWYAAGGAPAATPGRRSALFTLSELVWLPAHGAGGEVARSTGND